MTAGPLFNPKAARELFRTASVWRGAVIGGAVFTVLAVLFAPNSPRTSATYAPPPPRPTGTPPSPSLAAPPSVSAPAVPTSASGAPLTPVAPVVPKIAPGAQADRVADDPVKKDSPFGEAKEGEQPDGHIKPGQPLDQP